MNSLVAQLNASPRTLANSLQANIVPLWTHLLGSGMSMHCISDALPVPD